MEFFKNLPYSDDIVSLPSCSLSNENMSNNGEDQPKIDHRIGYYGRNGTPNMFETVRRAEKEIISYSTNTKAYSPFSGVDDFCRVAQEILLGSSYMDVLTVQTVGCTGALSLAIKLFILSKKRTKVLTTPINNNYASNSAAPTVYIPEQTWENHSKILKRYQIPYKTYRYYDKKTQSLDFNGMTEDIQSAVEGSIIIIQLCGHNPTGVDISLMQWFDLCQLIQKRGLLILFDAAYHGLASGCLKTDAEPIQILFNNGIEFMVAQTFSKNMGLYGERIGALHLIPKYDKTSDIDDSHEIINPDFKKEIWHLENLIRTTYSNPPTHGAKIVTHIWRNKGLRSQWEKELSTVVRNIKDNRQNLYRKLNELGHPEFSYFLMNRGFYSLLNLNSQQSESLRDKYRVYLKNRRINFAGLSEQDIVYLGESLVKIIDS